MKTTTPRGRSICLRDWEAAALHQGRCSLIVRPIRLTNFGPSDTPGYDWCFRDKRALWNDHRTADLIAKCCPFGRVGDLLACKEPWRVRGTHTAIYDADEIACNPQHFDVAFCASIEWNTDIYGKVRSAATMPQAFVRTRRVVAEVRVKRIRDMSSTDARHGCIPNHGYEDFLDKAHGRGTWESNLWCWFLRLEGEG